MSSNYSHSFVELCRAALELCGTKEGETVAVLAQGDQRADYARGFMDAATTLGAIAYQVTLPEVSTSLDGSHGAWTVGATPLARNRPVIDALKEADLMVDLMFLLFSKEQLEIQAADTRILLCIEPLDLLQRLFPLPEIRERVEIGGELLGKAKSLRFTNEAGTDVTYQMGSAGDHPVRLHRYTRPLGPLAERIRLLGRHGRRRRRQGRDRAGRHPPAAQVLRAVADRADDRAGPHRRHPRRRRREAAQGLHGRPSTTSAPTASRTSAGVSITAPAGPRCRPTRAAWAWRRAPSTATCSSRPGRTASSAARTTPPATSTSRCRAAASSSTTSRSSLDGDIVVEEMKATTGARA